MILDTNGQPILDTIHHCDALDLLRALPDGCIHMALIDMPYQTTALEWDTLPDLPALWTELRRVTTLKAALVFTASQPFTSKLIASNYGMFKYAWVWNKVNGATGLHAKHQPIKTHEDVIVFGESNTVYYPQMSTAEPRIDKARAIPNGEAFSGQEAVRVYNNKEGQYPKSILTFSNASQNNKQHPTQKPLALFEYLIRTYSLPNETVLDCFCGSGTTAHAAYRLDRHYICGDSDAGYVAIARKRLADANAMLDKVVSETHTQLSLFGG